MKNKERIESLESEVSHLRMHLEVLLNRIALLEMKTSPRVTQPSPQPTWLNTPFISPLNNPNTITSERNL